MSPKGPSALCFCNGIGPLRCEWSLFNAPAEVLQKDHKKDQRKTWKRSKEDLNSSKSQAFMSKRRSGGGHLMSMRFPRKSPDFRSRTSQEVSGPPRGQPLSLASLTPLWWHATLCLNPFACEVSQKIAYEFLPPIYHLLPLQHLDGRCPNGKPQSQGLQQQNRLRFEITAHELAKSHARSHGNLSKTGVYPQLSLQWFKKRWQFQVIEGYSWNG